MKDGKLESRDELRAWLDRPPPTVAQEPAEDHAAATDNERLVCLVHGTETCAHDKGAPFDEQLPESHQVADVGAGTTNPSDDEVRAALNEGDPF